MSAASASSASIAKTFYRDDNPEVTRSYAEALINVAGQGEQAQVVLDEVDAIASDVFLAHPRFAELLGSPLVSPADKDRVLVTTFEGRAQPTVVKFLRVLNRHGRLGSFGPISRAARALWDRRRNHRPVLVRSAVPLDGSQEDALRDRLARMLGATPILQLTVDPSLIGGLVIQVGDDLYDASIRNRLEQLRKRLIEGKAHGKVQS